MGTVRAKFVATTKQERAGAPGVSWTLEARYDNSIPEDQRYAQATPSGSLTMYVDNPAVSFELGRAYYLDIMPVPDVEAVAPSA